jgi:hypothetical protein
MNYITLEIDTLNTIRSGLIKQLNTIDKRLETLKGNTKFTCVDCAMVFSSQEKLDKHLVGKKHNDKIGVSPINCSACTNHFYGKDLVKHVEDGRCERSRTCKGCGVIFNTMMRKSRHKCSKRFVDKADNCKNITKKKKLKLVTKKKVPAPSNVGSSQQKEHETLPIFRTPSPVPELEPEPPVLVHEPTSNSLFVYDKPKYNLGELPATLDNVTPDWYESLHSGIKDGDKYFYKMEEEARALNNIYEDCPMRLEAGIIYESETGDKWFKMENIDNQYYKLVDLAPVEPPAVEWPKLERIDIVNNLEPLYTIGEKDFDEETYINLHQHAKDNNMEYLSGEMNSKFNDNIADIMDTKYQAGNFMFFDGEFLCRGDDKLFRMFEHHSKMFYDIEPVEQNYCELDTEEELELDETLVENM